MLKYSHFFSYFIVKNNAQILFQSATTLVVEKRILMLKLLWLTLKSLGLWQKAKLNKDFCPNKLF